MKVERQQLSLVVAKPRPILALGRRMYLGLGKELVDGARLPAGCALNPGAYHVGGWHAEDLVCLGGGESIGLGERLAHDVAAAEQESAFLRRELVMVGVCLDVQL